jgi:hypothetical protein
MGWQLWLFDGSSTALAGVVARRKSGPLYTATRSINVDPVNIFLDNDHLIEWDLQLPDVLTRALDPATGLSLTGFISTAADGTAIGSSTVALQEASGKPGTYYGTIDYATIDTDLTSLLGQRVFEVITDSVNLRLYWDLTVARRSGV